jgi:hypothetical protein
MNNEPVAWMAVNELNGSYSTFTNDQKQKLLPHVSQCYAKWIPLYTHPYKPSKSEVDALLDNADYVIGTMREEIEKLKAKTLTDEEIKVLASKHLCCQIEGSEVSGVFNFARAILRKAQEK